MLKFGVGLGLDNNISFQIAVYRFVGPTASKLTASHGGHRVCMGGAMVATLGLLAASFVNTIPLLILCYAVITGFGFGLMYIPAIVACVPYFSKNRSFLKPLKILEHHCQVSCYRHLLVWLRVWDIRSGPGHQHHPREIRLASCHEAGGILF